MSFDAGFRTGVLLMELEVQWLDSWTGAPKIRTPWVLRSQKLERALELKNHEALKAYNPKAMQPQA